MRQEFVIPNRLASSKDLLYTGANDGESLFVRERNNVKLCAMSIQKAGIEPIKRTCTLYIHWVEPSASRKRSDVAAAASFIERALVSCKIIKSRTESITKIVNTFAVNPNSPRVVVTIEED